ncbi:MAG: STM4015 family protein [Anaerolineae bacterium]|nr:STM4015 family protein [Anaerolineae bacterium]
MAFSEHLTDFAGKPVVTWERGKAPKDSPGTIYRLVLEWEEGEADLRWTDKFAEFLEHPHLDQIEGLVIGTWDLSFGGRNSSAPVVEALVSARSRFPSLKAICLGDIVYEECEISWIEQSDVSPLFNAFPDLEIFQVRGSNRLSLGTLRNAAKLKMLIVESGGLPVRVVQEVMGANLPELEHLKLFLGTPNYGGDSTAADLAPLLAGDLFPKLTYLGLCNSQSADDIAKAVAQAPIVNRLDVLDLSMGTLSDEGAQALLDSPLIAGLKKLDLHYHYCSEVMMGKLKALPIEVDVSEPQQPHVYDGRESRYCAVSE